MVIVGLFLDRVDSESGLNSFTNLYDMTPDQIIKDYELSRIKVPEHIKLIVFPCEYSKDKVQQIFQLTEGDEVYCWSEGCHDTVFNTSGIAFMELERDGVVLARWSLENSPYEMNDEDLEDIEFDMSVLPQCFTREQMIFVQQL